ncbi:MAG: YkgJ family cysteine cluster protein [Desulfobulbaceae bacterium]|nr:YkgJ family cysteine cluster protein [Desulfobulbaceae bacterium]
MIFKCRQCGHCCQGETTVSLDREDQERLIAYLRLPREEVCRRYLRVTGGVVQMKVVDGHCIFYREGCTIHSGKPWRCGEWPLHPSILADAANLTAIRASCPGLNREVEYQEFCALLAAYFARQKGKPNC